MNRIKGLVAISAFGLLVLGLPAIASAQWNGGYGNGGYGRNNGGYNDARYGNIRGTLQNLKQLARSFERSTDRADDRSNNNRIDRIEDLADDFAKATDRLADRYGNGRNMNNSADEARRVLDIAARIDQMIYNGRGGRGGRGGGYGYLQGQWSTIQRELNVVANAYGYNRGGRGNGGWRNNFPY